MTPLVLDRESERRVDAVCREAQEPIAFKTESEQYVIMTASEFASCMPSLSEGGKASLHSGYEDAQNGRVRNFYGFLDEIETRYSL